MFNLSSFLLGVAVVFIGGAIASLIGKITEYGEENAALIYCNFWWYAPIAILQVLWYYRPIRTMSQRDFKEAFETVEKLYKKHPDWTYDIRQIYKNIYSMRWNADRKNHPIRSRLKLIVIVKK